MTTLFFRATVSAGMVLALAAAAQAAAIAHIHGTITKIDPQRGTFMIHHDPFAGMPMSMTMEVEPKRRVDLRKLHVGEVIDATVDTTIVPWPGSDIRPASGGGHAK
jgi:Cu/Ag efflux protein CusF